MRYFIYLPQLVTDEFIINILILDAINISLFFLRFESVEHLQKQFFKLSTLFLVGFIIVHFQLYLEYVLGYYENLGHNYFITVNVIPKAIIVSSLALVIFFIGYSLKLKRKPNFEETIQKPVLTSTLILKVFCFIFFVFFVFGTDPSYFWGGYGRNGVELGGISAVGNEFFLLTAMGYFIVMTRNFMIEGIIPSSIYEYMKLFGKDISALVLIFLLLVLMSGDRGPILQLGLVILGCFIILTRKKYKIIFVTIFITISISLLAFMAYVREFKDTGSYLEKMEMASQIKASNKRSQTFSPNTIELAVSVRSLHAAILFTDNVTFTYGIFQGYQVFSIIPGFRSIFMSLTGVDGDEVVSTKFLTKQIQGEEVTHGLGTTSVADIYLDFGVIGVVIMFYLFGLFIRFIEKKMFSNQISSVFVWVLFFIFLSQSAYIGRSQIMLVLKQAVIVYLLVALNSFIYKLFFKKEKLHAA